MYNYDVVCCRRLSRAAPHACRGVCRGPGAPVAGDVMMYSVYCCCVASRARGVAASSTLLWGSRLSRAWEAAMGSSGGLSRSVRVAAHAHSVRGGGRRARVAARRGTCCGVASRACHWRLAALHFVWGAAEVGGARAGLYCGNPVPIYWSDVSAPARCVLLLHDKVNK